MNPMQVRIFTLPFDEKTESFGDELITEFCRNKKVLRIETAFFVREKMPFWSAAIHYDTVIQEKDMPREMNDAQKLLFQRLRVWRLELSQKSGKPPYLIATNLQFQRMIELRCTTLESLKQVERFGKSRINEFGKTICAMIKTFYEADEVKPSNVNQAPQTTNPEETDTPF